MAAPLPFYFRPDVFAAVGGGTTPPVTEVTEVTESEVPATASKKKKKKSRACAVVGALLPYIGMGVPTILELLAAGLVLWCHFLRSPVAFAPLLLFAMAWLHAVTPFFFIASLISNDSVKLLNVTAVLYAVVLMIDIVGLVLVVSFQGSFGSNMHFVWTVVAQSYFVLVDAVTVAVSSYLIGEEEARRERGEVEGEVDGGDEVEDVAEAKKALQGWGTVRMFLWLAFGLLAIVRTLFSMTPAWYLTASLPYLWAVPFIIGAATSSLGDSASAAILLLVFSNLGMVAILLARAFTEGGYFSSAYYWADILDAVTIVVAGAMAALDAILLYVSSTAYPSRGTRYKLKDS